MANYRCCLIFDYGLASTGVAVGHVATAVVQPVGVLPMHKGRPDWSKLDDLTRTWQPDVLVVGRPLQANGAQQPLTQQAEAFGQKMTQRFNLPVEWVDERYTTVDVRSDLFEEQGFKGLSKAQVDAASAVIIGQQWLRT